jgi:quinol monooxygenase YgiN
MSIAVFVELRVMEDRLPEIQPLFSALLRDTRSREGNEGVRVQTDLDSPDTIVLVQQWRTREHYESYQKWRTERGDLTSLVEMLKEPPRRRFFGFMAV